VQIKMKDKPKRVIKEEIEKFPEESIRRYAKSRVRSDYYKETPIAELTPKRELLEILRKHSYKKGEFILASGKKSDFYIDCKQTFLCYRGLQLAAGLIKELAQSFNAVAVAGEGVGGAPLAAAVAVDSGFFSYIQDMHLIVVRKATKDHGTTQRVERPRHAVPDGSRVVLVEDVFTTGGSAMRAVKALQADGLNVVAVIALVDRLEGAEELFSKVNIKLVSLYSRSDFVVNG